MLLHLRTLAISPMLGLHLLQQPRHTGYSAKSCVSGITALARQLASRPCAFASAGTSIGLSLAATSTAAKADALTAGGSTQPRVNLGKSTASAFGFAAVTAAAYTLFERLNPPSDVAMWAFWTFALLNYANWKGYLRSIRRWYINASEERGIDPDTTAATFSGLCLLGIVVSGILVWLLDTLLAAYCGSSTGFLMGAVMRATGFNIWPLQLAIVAAILIVPLADGFAEGRVELEAWLGTHLQRQWQTVRPRFTFRQGT